MPARHREVNAMTRITTIFHIVLALGMGLALTSCGRDASDAGAKLIGVGFDPGTVQPAPEPAGGLVDVALLDLASTNLDLGVTGMFYPGEAFADGSENFQLVIGFSYLFHPALETMDEYQMISPKGPDVMDTCFVTSPRVGPLGSFTTLDAGDELRIVADGGMEFSLPRDPGDYPDNTADVYTYYIGTAPLLTGHPVLGANFAFDQEVRLEWDGGVPPAGAPVASIPQPSWAPDERTGKPEGSPTIYAPPRLESVLVSNSESGTAGTPIAFTPTTEYPANPLSGEGDVVHVQWEPWEDAAEHNGFVVIQIKALAQEEEGDLLPCPWDPNQECECVPYGQGPSDLYCDTGYVEDTSIVGTESDYSHGDDCADGVDNDGDFHCDSDGCICEWDPDHPTCPEWMDGMWLGPDDSCPRHYKTRECRSVGGQNRCFNVGGDRNPDAGIGELTCTVADDGDFVISEKDMAELLAQIGDRELGGALLMVGRVTEERVRMPMVRDEIGNAVDIGDIRLRMSNITVGRLATEAGAQ